MKYNKTVKLKDGRECVLRNGMAADGKAVHDVFNLTHDQTDWLLSYSDENSFDVEQEAEFLQGKTESRDEIEIIAEIDGEVVGTAGIECVGRKDKLKHRAEFGIGVDMAYWSLGIGSALTAACIECAKKAGYDQLELNAVAGNEAAMHMYKKAGFVEYGRNPRGFKTRGGSYQELVYMRLEL